MISEEFKEHVIHEKIEQLASRLNDEEVKENIDLETFSFYESVSQYITDRLRLTIPVLVQENELNSLSNEIEAGLQQINSFIGNGNAGHITNANNNFYSALNRTRNLPLPFAKNDFNFSKAIANFQDSVQQKYESLEQENSELKQEIDELKSDLKTKTTEFQSDLESKQEELRRLAESLVEKEGGLIEALTEEYQEKHDSVRNSFKETIESDREEYREEINEQQNTFRAEIDDLKEKIDTDTSDLVSKLEKKLEDAKKIVNIVGNVGVTGNFQKIADDHKTTANSWRIVAIVFMGILSGLLVYTIWDISHGENFDWIKSLIRVIAAAALSYPATYAAKESSKHRKLESFNRRNELELASIEPFIELLPEDKKQQIKSKLVEKYFGNNEIVNDSTDSKEEVSVVGFEKIIKAILPILNK